MQHRSFICQVVLATSVFFGAFAATVEADDRVYPDGQASSYLRKSKLRAAVEKNDIILVQVIENDRASTDASLASQRKTETELLLDSFIRFSGNHLKPDFSPQPEIEIEGNKKVQGRGSTDRRENLRISIAAKVVDVLPNGNVIVEAYKTRVINDEHTKITLSGELRGDDILGDKSITSDRIYGLKLSYTGKGPVSATVGWTWLTWLVDLIWPF